MKTIIVLAFMVAGLTFLVFQAPFFSSRAEQKDLGVPYSLHAWEGVLQKVGNAPHGIVAGGIPVASSFTSKEVTAFLAVLAQERNLPVKNLQFVVRQGFFEASGIITKPVRGDVYVKGVVTAESPRKLSLRLHEVESSTIPVTEDFKNTLERAINTGIKNLFERFAPDERFLRIAALELQEDLLTIEGIFPQEFFPRSQTKL